MKAQLYKVYKNVVENVLPPLSHSQFKEKGVSETRLLDYENLVPRCFGRG
jgi:hypothetical protein